MTVQHATRVFEAEGFHSAAQRQVLLELAYLADRKGVVRYGQAEIATRSALSRATVAQWFRFFAEKGILIREGHGRYRLDMASFDPTEDGGVEGLLRKAPKTKWSAAAEAETERLSAIMGPNQGIRYQIRPDGLWPILVDDE